VLKRYFPSRWSFLLLGILAAGAPSPAYAATIYSTFGPGDSYETTAGWTIGGGGQEIAASFSPGFDATLDSIRLAQFFVFGTNDFTVYLAADGGGEPGTAIESFFGVPFTEGGILTLPSALNPFLNAGSTYWLVVTAPDLLASWGAWNYNDQGLSGFSYRAGGDWTASTVGETPAFEVNGTAAVPEPATLLLLGTGLGAVAARRRLKSRR
jgi:hypothetical protein